MAKITITTDRGELVNVFVTGKAQGDWEEEIGDDHNWDSSTHNASLMADIAINVKFALRTEREAAE